MEHPPEGWYTDPYARHEARWMSEGIATALVRDGGVEGHDPAPDGPFKVAPVAIEDDVGASGGADLRRADEVPRQSPESAAWDSAGENMA